MPTIFTRITSVLLMILTASIIHIEIAAQRSSDDTNIMRAAETSLGHDIDFFIKAARAARFGNKMMAEDDDMVKIRMTGSVLGHSKSYMVTAYRRDGDGGIHHIGIFLPEGQDWDELKGDYDSLKKRLCTLYGPPSETSESFHSSEPLSNAEKMSALKRDETDFTTRFTHGRTTILLSITYAEQYGAHVGMLYLDDEMIEYVEESLNGPR